MLENAAGILSGIDNHDEKVGTTLWGFCRQDHEPIDKNEALTSASDKQGDVK